MYVEKLDILCIFPVLNMFISPGQIWELRTVIMSYLILPFGGAKVGNFKIRDILALKKGFDLSGQDMAMHISLCNNSQNVHPF